MFDRILERTGRLGLSEEQARQLLGMTVALVFSPARGGSSAFLGGMRRQGLGGMLDSWLGPGPNEPITPAQAEDVLGADALARMAERTRLPLGHVATAVAAILPEAVHELSEHGDLPASAADIPAHLHGEGGALQHYLDEVAHWGRAAVNAGAAALGASVGVVPDAPVATTASDEDAEAPPARLSPPTDDRSHLLPWLAIAIAAAVAFLVLRSCGPGSPPPGSASAASSGAQSPTTS